MNPLDMTPRPLCPSGCGTVLHAGRVLCDPCWELLPKGIQRRVYDAWTTFADGNLSATARAYYEQAVADAVAAVKRARVDEAAVAGADTSGGAR